MSQAATALLVSFVSAAMAFLSVGWQARAETRRAKLDHELRREEHDASARADADRVMRRYREPLLLSADQLMSRLDNIMDEGFMAKYGEQRRDYVVNSTAFAIGELLCWMEVLRQEQQFLDLGDEAATRSLNEVLRAVGRTFSTDSIVDGEDRPAEYMLWRQEQRAIGELLQTSIGGDGRCIGYVAFTRMIDTPEFEPFFGRLKADIERSIIDDSRALPRLSELRLNCQQLIAHLDPEGHRVPART